MSDVVDEVKKTPLKPKQKWIMGLLGIVILVSGFVLGASTTFFVLQNKVVRPPWPGPNSRVAEFTEKYQLSPEQQPQLAVLFKRQDKQFLEMRAQFEETMKKDREQMVTDMKAILTPEQFKQWNEDFKKHMERFKRGGRGEGRRRGGPGPEGMGPDRGPGRGPGPGPNGTGPEGSPRFRGTGARGHDPDRPREQQGERNPDRMVEPKEE